MKNQKTETWGAELEFWAYEPITDRTGIPFVFFDKNNRKLRPISLWKCLNGKHHEDNNGSDIFLDAGINQCEIGIRPVSVNSEEDLCTIAKHLNEAIAAFKRLVPKNTQLFFGGKNPLRKYPEKQPEHPLPFNQKPVNTAYLQAIKIEGGVNVENGHWMTEYSSLQLHYEVGIFDEKTFKLLKWLSRFAPALACVHMNSPRLKEAWWGSGCPERQPHYFWYQDPGQYLEVLSQIPQLLDYADGVFSPRNTLPDNPLDPLHVACLSHFVKYRPDFGTIEFRAFDTPTHPENIMPIITDLRNVIHKIEATSNEELERKFDISQGAWWHWILAGTNEAGQAWLKKFLAT